MAKHRSERGAGHPVIIWNDLLTQAHSHISPSPCAAESDSPGINTQRALAGEQPPLGSIGQFKKNKINMD